MDGLAKTATLRIVYDQLYVLSIIQDTGTAKLISLKTIKIISRLKKIPFSPNIYHYCTMLIYFIVIYLQSLEANKMAQLAAKLSKIEEATKKKDEKNCEFINQTKDALEQKMESHTENREAYISELRAKLKEHVSYLLPRVPLSLVPRIVPLATAWHMR